MPILFIIGFALLGYTALILLIFGIMAAMHRICLETGEGFLIAMAIYTVPFTGIAGIILILIELISGYGR